MADSKEKLFSDFSPVYTLKKQLYIVEDVEDADYV